MYTIQSRHQAWDGNKLTGAKHKAFKFESLDHAEIACRNLRLRFNKRLEVVKVGK